MVIDFLIRAALKVKNSLGEIGESTKEVGETGGEVETSSEIDE